MTCNIDQCHVAKAVQFLSLALIARMKRNVDYLAASYIAFTKYLYKDQYPDLNKSEFYLFSDILDLVCQKDIYAPVTEAQVQVAKLFLSNTELSHLKSQYDLQQYLLQSYQRQVLETIDITFNEDFNQMKFSHGEYIEAMNLNGAASQTQDVKFSFGIYTDQLDQFPEYIEDLNDKNAFIETMLGLLKEYVFSSYYIIKSFHDYNHQHGLIGLSILSDNMLMNPAHIEQYQFKHICELECYESISNLNQVFWLNVRNSLSSYGILMPIGEVQVGYSLLCQNASSLDVTDLGLIIYLNILSHLINARYLAQSLCKLVKKVSIEYQCQVPSAFLFDSLEINYQSEIDFEQGKGLIKSNRIEFIRNIVQLINHCLNVKTEKPIFTRSKHDRFIAATNDGPFFMLDPSYIGKPIDHAILPEGAHPILETGLINLYVIIPEGIQLETHDLLVLLDPKVLDLEEFVSTIAPGPDFIYDNGYLHSIEMQKHYLTHG